VSSNRDFFFVSRFLLILTREVRWQAEIPQVVICTNTLLLILTHEVRWQAEIPKVVIRTHTVLLPRLMRSQVACGDALYGNLHTFRRQKCLQSLHAFKRRQCLHLHFENDNVFTSKTSISFSPMLHRTRRPLFVHFLKKNNNK